MNTLIAKPALRKSLFAYIAFFLNLEFSFNKRHYFCNVFREKGNNSYTRKIGNLL